MSVVKSETALVQQHPQESDSPQHESLQHDAHEHDSHAANGLRMGVGGDLFYFDPPAPPTHSSPSRHLSNSEAGESGPLDSTDSPKHPLTEIPRLHSNPTASQKLYLDFDGHIVEGTQWNAENGGLPIHAVPYDLDADLTTFSDEELERIHLIWQRVSEDFMPFDVDVTTQPPSQAALDGSKQAIRALITTNIDDASMGGTGDPWFSNAGGVAYIGSWTTRGDTPIWAFYNQLDNSTEKPVAEAVTHELGHAFGLSHDGVLGGTSYYAGHGSGETGWASIMGAGYSRNVTQWDKGDYAGANNTENDLAVISSLRNGIFYREDDHGNGELDATPLQLDEDGVLGRGIIERRNDIDFFSFEHSGGPAQFDIQPAPFGPNLDILVELFNDQGDLLELYEPVDQLSVQIDQLLEAGTYYLLIDGGGNIPADGSEGYNDYGSLGQYTIGPLNSQVTYEANAGPIYTMVEGGTVTLDGSSSMGDMTGVVLSWDLNGDGQFGDVTGVTPTVDWQLLSSLNPPIYDDGAFVIAVRFEDEQGPIADADFSQLHIENLPPQSDWSEIPNFAVVGEPVTFAVAAHDIPQDPLAYFWTFGNGQGGLQGNTVEHAFDDVGTAVVTVIVTDDDGGSFQLQYTFSVVDRPLQVIGEPVAIGAPSDVVISFSADVGTSLSAGSLTVWNESTQRQVNLSPDEFSYDAQTATAVWSVPEDGAEFYGRLQWALTGVTDAAGTLLDGDGDGLPGGTWRRMVDWTLPGDANLDFQVNFADFVSLAANFGRTGEWAEGDFDSDGYVRFSDFVLLASHFGESTF